jgi:hypothetical protein
MKPNTYRIAGIGLLIFMGLREIGIADFRAVAGSTSFSYSPNDLPTQIGQNRDDCEVTLDGISGRPRSNKSVPPTKIVLKSQSYSISLLRFVPLIHLGSNTGQFEYQIVRPDGSVPNSGRFKVIANESSFGFESGRSYKQNIITSIREHALRAFEPYPPSIQAIK